MSGGTTLQGRQAYTILDWAYENPQSRAAEALSRVDDLARTAAGTALAEVQDAGTMLSRLAGAVSETAQLAADDEPASLTAQALGLAFPDVPGFKGQGWSSQETVMVVRWLLGNPAAWKQAMDTARAYPGNTHTVADTLHEQIVPRSELDAIVTAGGDPARVDWLEIAHELIERRDDPEPAPVSLAAQVAAEPPDGPAAAMTTARHLHDTSRHLAAASGHLDAAREAPAADQDGHLGKCAASLDGAHASAHKLAAHLRDQYPDEGADLDALTKTIGLAVSVSDQAKTATTAHLTQTICNHLGHTIEHVKAMGDDPEPEVRKFNGEHARTHMDGAIEHVGKLTRHLRSNYPDEAGHLAELKAEPASISGQAGEPAGPKGYARPELAGTITAQLDLSAASRAKAHETASATARAHAREHELRDGHGRWSRDAGAAETPEEAVTRFADRAAKIVPGLLGGGHQAFSGKVKVLDPATYQGFSAALEWDGTMDFGGDLAARMQQDTAGTGPVSGPRAYLTVLHELIHGTVPEGQDYSAGMTDYLNRPEAATIEEGFTELGAIHHAAGFFTEMGVGGRDAATGDGGTMADYARQRAAPDRIASGDSWGHYKWETAAAQGWVTAAAAAEGKGGDRARELADEINREGVPGKLAALARQAVRASGADPAAVPASRLGAVQSAILAAWPDYPEGEAVQWAGQAWEAAAAAAKAGPADGEVAHVAA